MYLEYGVLPPSVGLVACACPAVGGVVEHGDGAHAVGQGHHVRDSAAHGWEYLGAGDCWHLVRNGGKDGLWTIVVLLMRLFPGTFCVPTCAASPLVGCLMPSRAGYLGLLLTSVELQGRSEWEALRCWWIRT